MSKVILSTEVRAVLERSSITADSVTLPPEQLTNYKQVNAVLEAAGGKWNKKARCHLFPSDPREALGLALQTGQIIDKAKARKKERQAFYTPAGVARDVVILADVRDKTVLEPSAGHGAIAKAIRGVEPLLLWCIDIAAEAVEALKADRFYVTQGDFLDKYPAASDGRYQRIVMNPPFTLKADAKHVRHAFTHWLADDGLLTSIVCDDGQDRPDLRAIDPDTYQVVMRYPAGTFKESGTNIATLVIQLRK